MTNLDVSKAIQAKSDQLNADDLVGGPVTIKIRDVDVRGGDQPIQIYYVGDDGKPWRPCKTAARCLAAIWGPNAAQWVGMSCTIYNDPTVTWAGAAVGGIRVSHMEGLDKPRSLKLAKTRGKKGDVTIKPLTIEAAPAPDEAVLQAARDAATKGREEFGKWWKANKQHHEAAGTILDELKGLVDKAEEAKAAEDEIPL